MFKNWYDAFIGISILIIGISVAVVVINILGK